MSNEILTFSLFLTFIGGMLALDLGVLNKKNHIISFKEAGIWSGVWVSIALIFFLILRYNGELVHGIFSMADLQALKVKYNQPFLIDAAASFAQNLDTYRLNLATEFITGYLIEYALSVDNIFVIILIFSSFSVREKYYKKVLFWGILGAVIMRFIFIFLGAALLQQFEWVLYVFGGFLILTGVKMLFDGDDDGPIEPNSHPIVKFTSKYFSVFPKYVGEKFFVKKKGKILLTPLFVVLLIIEFTDLIFAVDSVPAVFAITKDPYIVFFSNIFAIMGLRSMFFFLASVMHLFHYLKLGLSVLLPFIGAKMIFHHWLESVGFTNLYSLLVILGILAVSILASIIFPKKDKIA